MTIQRNIAALIRRRDHLANRIANSDKNLTYDKAELAALNWAIETLRPPTTPSTVRGSAKPETISPTVSHDRYNQPRTARLRHG